MFIVGALIFVIVCIKRRDLVSWIPAYIAGSLSEILRLISQVDYDIFYLIGLVFSSLTVLLMIVAVSREYYMTFYKSPNLQIIPILQIALVQLIFSIGLQVIIGFLLVIAFFMILRITLKKRTPTHIAFCFILLCGIFNLIAIAIRDVGIEEGELIFQFSSIVMTTNLILTGPVALMENKLVNSEKKYRLAFNRAEFYKDLFVHDINNILQNLQFSLDIITQNIEDVEKKEKLEEMIKIAKEQVNRGAELGLNVKKLSDLEVGSIKTEPVELIKLLENSIKYIKTKFPEEEIKIEIGGEQDKIFVNANILLQDVFRIILNNAVKYNKNSKKEITINVTKEMENFGSNVKLEFIDNGIGIPDIMKKSIFQPFYQKTKDFERIGLGLLLVNEVIENISGKVWIEDKISGDYKKGSNIVVLIPEAHGILDIKR
jgi:signal transduction histidine kinase